jgi:hypothetical protein
MAADRETMMVPTWQWSNDFTTYPDDTYLVVRTVEDGKPTTDRPVWKRVWGVFPPAVAKDGTLQYQHDRAVACARALCTPGKAAVVKSWAIVIATQDVPAYEPDYKEAA